MNLDDRAKRGKHKIAILTYPFNANFGGVLQNYALQQVLIERGFDVTTVCLKDIVTTRWWKLLVKIPIRLVKKIFVNKKVVLFVERKINTEIPIIRQQMDRFVGANINTKVVNNYNEIKESDYKAIVVGSDQVWSHSLNNLYNYYLDFTKGWSIRRIAYAPSFGYTRWCYSKNQTRKCQRLIKSFNHVGIREASGVELCESYLGIKAKLVLDPTLLLKSETYMRHITIGNDCKNRMFVYVLDKTNDKEIAINNISHIKKLTAFSINKDVDNVNLPIKDRIQPTIEDWLSALYYSDFVFTDSFHGMVFSIIFNKQFIAYSNRGAARFESLLNQLNLRERLITNSLGIIDIVNNPINYEIVNHSLDNLRNDSLSFIDQALKNI